MSDDGRREQIAEVLETLVEPEEAWVVRGGHDGVDVFEEKRSSLSSTHPELYGRMLQINEGISNAGGWFVVGGLIVVLGACLAVHMGWLDEVIGAGVAKVRSIWVYGFAVFVSVVLLGGLATGWERVVYSRHRYALLSAIEDAKLTPHRVLAEIENDEGLHDLADRMKNDLSLA